MVSCSTLWSEQKAGSCPARGQVQQSEELGRDVLDKGAVWLASPVSGGISQGVLL